MSEPAEQPKQGPEEPSPRRRRLVAARERVLERLMSVEASLVRAFPVLSFCVGLVLVCFGVWLVYKPAGFIAAGVVLVVVPWLHVRGETGS